MPTGLDSQNVVKSSYISADYDYAFVPSLSVIPDDEPEYSGLLDARGYPLVRHREPIGFVPNALERVRLLEQPR